MVKYLVKLVSQYLVTCSLQRVACYLLFVSDVIAKNRHQQASANQLQRTPQAIIHYELVTNASSFPQLLHFLQHIMLAMTADVIITKITQKHPYSNMPSRFENVFTMCMQSSKLCEPYNGAGALTLHAGVLVCIVQSHFTGWRANYMHTLNCHEICVVGS